MLFLYIEAIFKMKKSRHFANLIHRNLKNELNQEEVLELRAWAESNPAYQKLLDDANHQGFLGKELKAYENISDAQEQRVLLRVLNHIQKDISQEVIKQPVIKQFKRYRWLSAAAAILLIAGISYFFSLQRNSIKDNQVTIILPGTNKATLTLSNGKKIELDSNYQSVIVSNKDIKYGNDSLISVIPTASISNFNTLSTPQGGQYQVTLPDGTKAWLNAKTTLKYPTQFSSEKRVVELDGEAYFEVNHHPYGHKKPLPFIVKSRKQEVMVLGTTFNINAYTDEPHTKTTLVQGSVQVLNLSSQSMNKLTPGMESLITDQNTRVRKADVFNAVAWKDGLFSFRNASVEELMRQLRRWYGVDVVFEGTIPRMRINGEVNRNMTANKVFEVLDYLEIAFRVDGNRIIIRNKTGTENPKQQ